MLDEIIKYCSKKYNFILQFNNKEKINTLVEKVGISKEIKNKYEIKKDLTKKLEHPLFIKNEPSLKIYDKELFLSKNSTRKEKTRIYNSEENKPYEITNEFISNNDLFGSEKTQYLSKQGFFSTKDTFVYLKDNKILDEVTAENMYNFIITNGSKIENYLNDGEIEMNRCLKNFSQINNKLTDHIIICNKLINKEEIKLTDYIIEAEKYKLAELSNTTFEYISSVLAIGIF